MKESVKNAETGKFKDEPKGLGHWRCSGCRKGCKVTPRKPVKVVAVDMAAVEAKVVASLEVPVANE